MERSSVYVLGVDPGLTSTGYVLCRVSKDHLRTIMSCPKEVFHRGFVLLKAGVSRTKKDTTKKIRVCDDRLLRTRDILWELRTARSTVGESPVLWCTEEFVSMPGRVNNAASMYTYAVYGAIYGMSVGMNDTFVPVRPCESKAFVTGRKTATKEMAYALIVDRLDALRVMRGIDRCGVWPASCNEHVADAFCAAVYGVYLFKDMLMSMGW